MRSSLKKKHLNQKNVNITIDGGGGGKHLELIHKSNTSLRDIKTMMMMRKVSTKFKGNLFDVCVFVASNE